MASLWDDLPIECRRCANCKQWNVGGNVAMDGGRGVCSKITVIKDAMVARDAMVCLSGDGVSTLVSKWDFYCSYHELRVMN